MALLPALVFARPDLEAPVELGMVVRGVGEKHVGSGARIDPAPRAIWPLGSCSAARKPSASAGRVFLVPMVIVSLKLPGATRGLEW